MRCIKEKIRNWKRGSRRIKSKKTIGIATRGDRIFRTENPKDKRTIRK